MKTGKSVEWGLLDRQEDRDYQYFDGVQICVCAIICKTKEICKSVFIKENIDETIFMFAFFKCRKSDKGRN